MQLNTLNQQGHFCPPGPTALLHNASRSKAEQSQATAMRWGRGQCKPQPHPSPWMNSKVPSLVLAESLSIFHTPSDGAHHSHTLLTLRARTLMGGSTQHLTRMGHSTNPSQAAKQTKGSKTILGALTQGLRRDLSTSVH